MEAEHFPPIQVQANPQPAAQPAQPAQQGQRRRRPLKYTPLRVNDMVDFTSNNLDVRHNLNFMNPHFVNNLIQNDERYQGWTFVDNQDIDGDNIVDSVLYDPQHQPVYFNGYYNIPNGRTIKKKNYYHDARYAANNWDNETYKEYMKTDYEILILRKAKAVRASLKQMLEGNNVNEDVIKMIMRDITGAYLRSLIHKYLVIPILIKHNGIHNITNAQYIQLFQQVLNSPSHKELDNRALMALYKHAKKDILANISQQNLNVLSGMLDRILTQQFVNTLYTEYSREAFTPIRKIRIGMNLIQAVQNMP